MYSFLVRYAIALKLPLLEYCNVLNNAGLLNTGFQVVASVLVVISRSKGLFHCTGKLFPCHICGIPVLNTEPICRLTSEAHHGLSGLFSYRYTILLLVVEGHCKSCLN